MACQHGHMDVVRALLATAEGLQGVSQAKNDGSTPLRMACQKGLVNYKQIEYAPTVDNILRLAPSAIGKVLKCHHVHV